MIGIVYNYNVRFGISRGRFRYRCNATQYAVSVFVATLTVIIMNECLLRPTMDARRFDRNADQLAQIYHHMNKTSICLDGQPGLMTQELLIILQRALYLNNELGKMAEKGLI